MIKSCTTCAHKVRFWDYCRRVGTYASVQRGYPDPRCDADFSGWEPRETNCDQLISNLIWFALGFGLGVTAFFLKVM